MSQQELLILAVQTLEQAGIPYFVTGSIASSLHGEPRSTHDIDLVVSLPRDAVAGLIAAFPPAKFYLSEGAVLDAIQNKFMFNLLSLQDGEKVDFWLMTDDPFDRSRFLRKRVETISGMAMNVATPEDTILAKLRWAILSGGSEKQFTDALRVYEVQQNCLDQTYLDVWAAQLGVGDLLTRLRAEAELP